MAETAVQKTVRELLKRRGLGMSTIPTTGLMLTTGTTSTTMGVSSE